MKIRIPYWYLLILPSLLMWFGMFLNAFAVMENGHTMPVLVTNCQETQAVWSMWGDTIHSCMTHSTKYKILTDWFFIPNLGTASIGDFFEWISDKFYLPFIYMWVALIIKKFNNEK